MKEKWVKIQDFANENNEFLFIVASPKTDEIYSSFNGLATFVRFPFESMDKGVVFNALRKSKFEEAIDPFMTGVIEGTGIKETEEGGEVLKVIGGSVKAMGMEGANLVTNKKKNAKKKK